MTEQEQTAAFEELADRLMGRGMMALGLNDWPLLVLALERECEARSALAKAQPEAQDGRDG